MNKILTLIAAILIVHSAFAQQAFYDVTAADGNGIRFWAVNDFKMHMGNTAEYHYGPVTDYSIKTNMTAQTGRGWTWGTQSITPVAALSNTGVMQLAGNLYAGPYIYSSASPGMISSSGTGAGYTLLNRAVTSFVLNPTNGERWSIYSDGTTTDGKFKIWSGADYFTILKDGKTGVGTTTPTTRLEVGGAVGSSIDFKVNGRMLSAGGGLFVDNTQTLFMGTSAAGKIGFYNNLAWRMIVDNAGNVGVGTEAPTARLEVAGAGGSNIDFRVNGRMQSIGGGVFVDGTQSLFMGTAGTGKIGFYNNLAWRLIVDSNGNVGIGTTTPDAALTVKGTVHAREVKVDLTGAVAPDYVFDKDYKLPSLAEIKSYVDKHHHLPEVPSAKQMEEEGMNVGEMNLILLKKIEELTLYIIDQEARIKALEAKNK